MAAVPVFAQELLAWVAQGALAPWASRVMQPPRAVAAGRVTYLLHGAWAPPSVFWPMRRYLEDKVEGEIVIWGYGGALDVADKARRFARFVQRHHPEGRVDLVGHSLGGLIARYWAQELGGAPRVDRLVTLATPHRGTRSARFVPLARELRPGSELLQRLDASAGALAHVRITTVAARGDFLVLPTHHALLDEGDAHHLDEVGHNGLLFSPRVFGIVADCLR